MVFGLPANRLSCRLGFPEKPVRRLPVHQKALFAFHISDLVSQHVFFEILCD